MSLLVPLVMTSAASTAVAGETGEIAGVVRVSRLAVASGFKGFEEVLVYLEDAPNTGGMPRGPFQIEQRNKSFDPDLLVVPKGASVSFPNSDRFAHNVFSVASGNSFDLGLYTNGTSRSAIFDHAGIVPVYCNVHPQMVSYIIVVTNPFFVRPKSDGAFKLGGIPPGDYHVVAWFARGLPARGDVHVEAGKPAAIKLELRELRPPQRHLNKVGKPYVNYSERRRARQPGS